MLDLRIYNVAQTLPTVRTIRAFLLAPFVLPSVLSAPVSISLAGLTPKKDNDTQSTDTFLLLRTPWGIQESGSLGESAADCVKWDTHKQCEGPGAALPPASVTTVIPGLSGWPGHPWSKVYTTSSIPFRTTQTPFRLICRSSIGKCYRLPPASSAKSPSH